MPRRARVALQALKLSLYVALALVNAQVAAQVDCSGRCGQQYLDDGAGSRCHCDYWCNNRNDCCGGSASKNELCPHLR
jgi:hypothetical protein